MRTAKITLRVAEDRLGEWREWIKSVPGTTAHPIPGDRILTAARAALEAQAKRRVYKRDYYRRTQGKKATQRKKSGKAKR